MDSKIMIITIDQFDKLKELYPDDDFTEYKVKRINQIINKELDIFVIEKDHKYVGEMTATYVNGELETETIPNVRIYFQALRVLEEYQNMGLAQKLIKYVIDYYEKLGYTEFTIGVEEDNYIAKHIYRKLGFTKIIDKCIEQNSNKVIYTLYLRSEEDF